MKLTKYVNVMLIYVNNIKFFLKFLIYVNFTLNIAEKIKINFFKFMLILFYFDIYQNSLVAQSDQNIR